MGFAETVKTVDSLDAEVGRIASRSLVNNEIVTSDARDRAFNIEFTVVGLDHISWSRDTSLIISDRVVNICDVRPSGRPLKTVRLTARIVKREFDVCSVLD